MLLVQIAAGREPPKVDAGAVINKSYSFLRNKEPEMTEVEFALYDRVVGMVAVQPEVALQLLQTIVSGKEQKSPAFDFMLGNLYYANKRPDLAEKHYRGAVERYPNFLRAWSNLGLLYYTEGRYDEALRCLGKAIQEGDREARTLGLLAYCLDSSGNSAAAEMAYMQAVSLDPSNADWISALLGHYAENKKYPQAESLARQLIRLHPDQKQNWMVCARVLLAQEKKTDAIGVLEAASTLGLLDSEGWLMLAEQYAEQKRSTEAVAAFSRLLSLNVALGAGRLVDYAESLVSEGRLEDAEKVLAPLGQNASAYPRVLQCRADLAFARREWTNAIKMLKELTQSEPLNGRALLRLSESYKKSGDAQRAEFTLETLARIPTYAYEAHIELGDLALKARQNDRALVHLRAALALRPTSALQEFIARLELLPTTQDRVQSAETQVASPN